ncbi:MAG: hypothetical protein J7J61_07145 [Candidatus Hydrothermae bacterium]|nr:hypothetical protein [Candidatus Hydrothermae bacterium]
MKFVVNMFGVDIEIELEINEKENEKDLVVRVKNIDSAVLKLLGVKK